MAERISTNPEDAYRENKAKEKQEVVEEKKRLRQKVANRRYQQELLYLQQIKQEERAKNPSGPIGFLPTFFYILGWLATGAGLWGILISIDEPISSVPGFLFIAVGMVFIAAAAILHLLGQILYELREANEKTNAKQ